MMPGRLDRVVPKTIKCSFCGGWDVASVGVIHHTASCTRNTCTICHLEVLPGEDRAFGPPVRHRDCAVDLEAQLDEDHRA